MDGHTYQLAVAGEISPRVESGLAGKGLTMEGSSEYMVVARPGAAFEALREVVLERQLALVEEDVPYRRLAFRLGRPQDGQIKALCTILDVGDGFSKLVVVCVDEADGSVVAPDASLTGLFIQVEHTLHTAWGNRRGVALPPVIEFERRLHIEKGARREFALPPLQFSR